MGSNVIPSAPEPSIYPQLPQLDFRMQKANEIAASLDAEVAHYRGVAKKYKRAKKIVNWSATGTGLPFCCLLYRKFRVGALCHWHPCRQFHLAVSAEHSLLLLLG